LINQMSPEFARLSAATDPDVAWAAWENLNRGELVLLLVSGWIASGKDSVAPAVMSRLGVSNVEHVYFAQPLKAEVDALIALLSDVEDVDPDPTIVAVAEHFSVPLHQAAAVVGALWAATRRSGHGLTARTRTPEMRFALQYWGTEIRRAQDEDYWVKRALPPALRAMAEGYSVYGTDARFLNEVLGGRGVGFKLVRLDITREVQRTRLLARDGVEPDSATLHHLSETALDDWDGFDLRIDNSGPMAQTVEVIAALYERSVLASAS